MENKRQESIEKLKNLIEEIDFAMLTTFDKGRLRSRPMSTQKFEFDGDLWFFTSDNTHKVEEINQNPHVNVAYSKPEENAYVSVSGVASLVKDREKMEELWNPILKAWFPKGLDDPTLSLLKIEVEEAEYWDAPSSAIVQIAGFVKSIVTGQEAQGGNYGRVSF